MALKQEEITIDTKSGSNTYLITTFPAMRGLNYLKRLTRLVGPAIMAANGEGDVLDGKSAMQVAIESLMDATDKVEVEQLILDLLGGATLGGKAIDVDNHFSGEFGAMGKLIFAILKLNYGNFMEAITTESLNGVMAKVVA